MKPITIFLRKKRKGENSMEMLLKSLSPFLEDIQILELPEYSTSFLGILKNIKFAITHQTKINHIYSVVDGYLALFIKKPILTIHDFDNLENLKIFSKIIIFLISVYLPSIKVVKYHCISHYTKNRLWKYLPWRRKAAVVIHNPLNPLFTQTIKDKELQNEKIVILQIGTGKRKNLETVIEAIHLISDKNIELHIVGVLSCSQLKLLESYHINYKNYVDVPVKKLLELYNKADIVTFPSSAEGFGMIVIESNACGVPVIAGDIPVLREVGKEAALYVNPSDVTQLKDAIVKLVTDQDLRDNIIIKGNENALRFNIKLISQEYTELYESIK